MMHVNDEPAPVEDELAFALLELVGFLNSPRQDEVLLKEAGVALDRALFPVLARIGLRGTTSLVDLAEDLGRDPSTVSRQVARLEELGFVARVPGAEDRRVRAVATTPAGAETVARITAARRRVFTTLLAGWDEAERQQLPRLIRRLTGGLKSLGG